MESNIRRSTEGGDALLRPRNRVQDMMRNAAEDVYWKTVSELEDSSRSLEVMLEGADRTGRFKSEAEDWMHLSEEMGIAEREWSRCLNPDELPEVGRIFGETREKFQDLRRRVENYLSELVTLGNQGDVQVTDSPMTQQLQADRDEVTRLQAEVNRLAEELRLERGAGSAMGGLPDRFTQHTPASDGSYARRNAPIGSYSSSFSSYGNTPRQQPSNDSEQLVSQLTLALNNVHKAERLPRAEPDVFTGDSLKFPLWWNTFNMTIDRDATDVRDKLVHLSRYTAGEGKEAIQHLLDSVEDIEESYEEARRVLKRRFGDRFKISETYRERLRSWPSVKQGDARALRKYADFLWQCNTAIKSVGFLGSLEHPEENVRLANKLPGDSLRKWNRAIIDHRYPRDGQAAPETDYPTFKTFCQFVDREAQIADGPCVQRKSEKEAPPRSFGGDRRRAHTFDTGAKPAATGVTRPYSSSRGGVKCLYCQGSHFVSQCTVFLQQEYNVKKTLAQQNGLCYGCLRRGHYARECSRGLDLLKRTQDAGKTAPKTAARAAEATSHNVKAAEYNEDALYSMIVPVYVSSSVNDDPPVATYALLDTQSDSGFLRSDLAESLHTPGRDIKLTLSTMGKKCTVPSRMISNHVVQGYGEDKPVSVRSCYTREEIPTTRDCIPRPELVERWRHLEGLRDKLLPIQHDWEIGMLIGYDCPAALMPVDVIPAPREDQPYAVKTVLGWSVVGPSSGSRLGSTRFCFGIRTKEVQMEDLQHAFDFDFRNDGEQDGEMSLADEQFLKIMEAGGQQLEDGHYQLPLPVKENVPPLPYSRGMAYRRLMCLKKFARNPEFKSRYIQFIVDMAARNHIEIVPATELDCKRVWYLPHQGVVHPRKKKVRVVFDGSSECCGVCLNSILLSGPDMVNLLIGVFIRFGIHKVAFVCDIEGMFLQVVVDPEDRDLLRFLWFRNNDPSEEVVEYRVRVHLFGATSSPACATYALRAIADRYAAEFTAEVVDFIKRNFYVDDGLKSEPTVDDAWKMIQASRELCARGAFNLHKYVCNNAELMERIPEDWRAKDLTPAMIVDQNTPPQVVLGTNWSLWDDTLRYPAKEIARAVTRRGMLSILGSFYDPMGLVSPVILEGRLILQSLCRAGVTWDEAILGETQVQWDEWVDNTQQLATMKIPRCVSGEWGVQGIITLHLFSDASGRGHGACAYLVFQYKNGHLHSALIFAKLRMNPKKAVTIPRMELQAAVLADKMKRVLEKELPFPELKFRFWSDSQIVLAYIYNPTIKLKIYSKNRVQVIRDNSAPEEWAYVTTERNPADLASRGVSAAELGQSTLWFEGPKELFGTVPEAPEFTVPEDDPEVQQVSTVLSAQSEGKTYPCFVEKIYCISEWTKMVSFYAVWCRVMRILLSKVQGTPCPKVCGYITLSEREHARKMLLRGLQQEVFPLEYYELSQVEYPESQGEARDQKNTLMAARQFRGLDAYMDSEGLIRVGGRLRRACLPLGWKHPYILPPFHPVTAALIRFYHALVGHAKKDKTIVAMRSDGLWVQKWQRALNRVLSRCVPCKKAKAPAITQKMADLPEDRVNEAAPFTYVGVDMFGPFLIRVG